MCFLNFRTLLFLVALWTITACNKEDYATPISYSWRPSQWSLGLHTGYLEVINDELYALGYGLDFQTNHVFKYNGVSKKWDVVGQVPLPYYRYYGFTVYAGEVYLHRFNELLKLKNGQTEIILEANFIGDVAEFKGKLLITGQALDVSGAKYSLVSYNGTSFTPLYDGYLGGPIVKGNDKVFMSGNPSCKYDGTKVEKMNHVGYFRSVDDEENIYGSQGDGTQT